MMVSTSLRLLGSLVTARRFIQGLFTHYEFSVSLNTKNAVTTIPNLFAEQRPTSFLFHFESSQSRARFEFQILDQVAVSLQCGR